MKIMYKTSKYGTPITPVEVERETEACVWIKGSRNNKITSYEGYFNTQDEAEKHLINEMDKEIESKKAILQYYLDQKDNLLKRLKDLKSTTHKTIKTQP